MKAARLHDATDPPPAGFVNIDVRAAADSRVCGTAAYRHLLEGRMEKRKMIVRIVE